MPHKQSIWDLEGSGHPIREVRYPTELDRHRHGPELTRTNERPSSYRILAVYGRCALLHRGESDRPPHCVPRGAVGEVRKHILRHFELVRWTGVLASPFVQWMERGSSKQTRRLNSKHMTWRGHGALSLDLKESQCLRWGPGRRRAESGMPTRIMVENGRKMNQSTPLSLVSGARHPQRHDHHRRSADLARPG